MKKQVIESSVKVLYVETIVKMLEKRDTRQFIRCHKLLESLDEYMNSGGLRTTITVGSERIRKK